MARSIKAGSRVTLEEGGPFSDGTAVKIVGVEPFRLCQEVLDSIELVNNDELCAAIKDIFEGNAFSFSLQLCLTDISKKRALLPSLPVH